MMKALILGREWAGILCLDVSAVNKQSRRLTGVQSKIGGLWSGGLLRESARSDWCCLKPRCFVSESLSGKHAVCGGITVQEASEEVAVFSSGLVIGTPASTEEATCPTLADTLSLTEVVKDQVSLRTLDGSVSLTGGVKEQVADDQVTFLTAEGSMSLQEGVKELEDTVSVTEGADDHFRQMRALCEEGKLKAALNLVDEQGLRLDVNACGFLLECAIKKKALAEGRRIREHVTRCGLDLNTYLRNNIMRMYSECKHMELARQEFDGMSRRTLFSWTTIITGYAANNQGKEALNVFDIMLDQGVKPDGQLLVTVLNATAKLRSLNDGKRLHALIEEKGYDKNLFVLNTLVDMYGKCGDTCAAREIFEGMTTKDVVTWNAIIAGYAINGQGAMALELYKQMGRGGVKPNELTFVGLLKACTGPADLTYGKSIHQGVIQSGFESHAVAGTAVLHMYVKCGSIDDARLVFRGLSKRDVVSWTAMMTGCNSHGLYQESCQLFREMQLENVKPNRFTYGAVLTALSKSGAEEEGSLIHADLKKKGLELDVATGTNLVNMYVSFGNIKEARELFDRMPRKIVVTWVILITGYLQAGNYDEPPELFSRMLQEGLKPTETAFVNFLNACVGQAALGTGKLFQAEAVKALPLPSAAVQEAILDMHVRCGSSLENGASYSDNVLPDKATTRYNIGALTSLGKWEYVAAVKRKEASPRDLSVVAKSQPDMVDACGPMKAHWSTESKYGSLPAS